MTENKIPQPPPPFDGIRVINAREHNLKSIDVEIPRNKITVITGLSGSGKSSLAFDTIYAEGQRRYIDSLSSYARHFLEQMPRPQTDSITGLSPSIAIDQKSVSTNPRSTVGTVTEVYDYLRLLFAKVGQPKCPEHGLPVVSQTPQQIVYEILRQPEGTKFHILAPMAQGKKGEFTKELQAWSTKGFVRAIIDGEMVELSQVNKLAKTKAHDIDLVIDRLILKPGIEARLAESLNTALSLAAGQVALQFLQSSGTTERKNYSIHSACPLCGFSFPPLEPRLFSFNNPRGACQTCNGLGHLALAEDAPVSDEDDDSVSEFADEGELCPTCRGTRLRSEALNCYIDEKNIVELSKLGLEKLDHFLAEKKWGAREGLIAEKIVRQIRERLGYLLRVGTGYLSLDRSARTLSGGEAQRIRLATQLGSSLVGVLYVLDEPSIGLHPRDHGRLLKVIEDLRDRGNTILLVEHDEETIRSADWIIDMGPRAGTLGGEVIAKGTPSDIEKSALSLTGKFLSGALQVPLPKERRTGNGCNLELLGAKGNNLHNVDLLLPLGTFIAVSGVSGSGKSTLIVDTLYKYLAQHFYKAGATPSEFVQIKGVEHLDKVIEIDQRPIGRTPRSTPATYVGLLPLIRDLFSQIPDARIRGYKPGRFSFNTKGGRCETCQGHGKIRLEMHFLADVYVPCDFCQERRYNRETLQIRYRGKSIADVLDMSVSEAVEFFSHHRNISRKLVTLQRVGLDYMTLGQSSTTLSGGEAQRVKLAKELSKRDTGKTLYILDEPTTGLHFEDVRKLIELLQELVTQGNTVLVIEHQLDVIKSADHVIDLGPDGGEHGGYIVAVGTPEQVAKNDKSHTGVYLRPLLERKRRSQL